MIILPKLWIECLFGHRVGRTELERFGKGFTIEVAETSHDRKVCTIFHFLGKNVARIAFSSNMGYLKGFFLDPFMDSVTMEFHVTIFSMATTPVVGTIDTLLTIVGMELVDNGVRAGGELLLRLRAAIVSLQSLLVALVSAS